MAWDYKDLGDQTFFVEWIHEVFDPSDKKSAKQKVAQKCLLVLDNPPLQRLENELVDKFNFIPGKYLPPNTTLLIQPMDQQVIVNLKKTLD